MERDEYCINIEHLKCDWMNWWTLLLTVLLNEVQLQRTFLAMLLCYCYQYLCKLNKQNRYRKSYRIKGEKVCLIDWNVLSLTIWLNSLVNRLVFHSIRWNDKLRSIDQRYPCIGSPVSPTLSTFVALNTHSHRNVLMLSRTSLGPLAVRLVTKSPPIRIDFWFLCLHFSRLVLASKALWQWLLFWWWLISLTVRMAGSMASDSFHAKR